MQPRRRHNTDLVQHPDWRIPFLRLHGYRGAVIPWLHPPHTVSEIVVFTNVKRQYRPKLFMDDAGKFKWSVRTAPQPSVEFQIVSCCLCRGTNVANRRKVTLPKGIMCFWLCCGRSNVLGSGCRLRPPFYSFLSDKLVLCMFSRTSSFSGPLLHIKTRKESNIIETICHRWKGELDQHAQ